MLQVFAVCHLYKTVISQRHLDLAVLADLKPSMVLSVAEVLRIVFSMDRHTLSSVYIRWKCSYMLPYTIVLH